MTSMFCFLGSSSISAMSVFIGKPFIIAFAGLSANGPRRHKLLIFLLEEFYYFLFV